MSEFEQGLDDETFEQMVDRLNVLPLPERDPFPPPSPSQSSAYGDEPEHLGSRTTGNPLFSAGGGQSNP